jgi:hypothetical protein
MSNEHIERIFKKLKNLAQYKDFADLDLWKIAMEKINEDEKTSDDLDVEGMFVDSVEKKEAKGLLKRYLRNYTFDSESEKNTVKQLVFLEVFNNRLQRELNTYHQEKQPAPVKTVEALHANLSQISNLKAQLGIRKDSKSSQSDAYLAFETLKRKMKRWQEENQGSRTLLCPHCGKMTLLRINMDAWTAQKHPFFIDRVLANKHLMLLYRDNKINQDDVAKVLETSTDYVTWLLDKIFPKQYKKIPNESVDTSSGEVVQKIEESNNGEQ